MLTRFQREAVSMIANVFSWEIRLKLLRIFRYISVPVTLLRDYGRFSMARLIGIANNSEFLHENW